MQYDALLLYLSEMGEGTWSQFKRAVRAVQQEGDDEDAAGAARVISALGHAEFAWEPTARWAICPAALVALPRRLQPAAILCGQRSPTLLNTLQTLAERHSIVVSEHPQDGGPKIVQLHAQRVDTLEQLADSLHIRYARQAVEQLAVCLPPLAALVEASPRCPRPVVPPIAVFDQQARQWCETGQVSGDGLYQYENFYPDYRLLWDGQWRMVSKEVGIYALLGCTVWVYDPEQHILRIPVRLLPPPLYQRVLVLSSGELASFDRTNRHWVYRAVPPAVAIALGQKLQQPL